MAFDTETDSAEEHKANVIGLSVTGYVDEGYYAAFGNFNPVTRKFEYFMDTIEIKLFISKLTTILLKKKLIMHNAVFDITVMKKHFGVSLLPALFADTILLKHTIAEERPFGLKDIAVLYQQQIGIPMEDVANQEQQELAASVKKNGGKWTNDQKDIYKGDFQIIGKYACADVDLTLRVFEYFDYELEEQGLTKFFYDEEVMPLCREATIPMKEHGVFVDVEYFKSLEQELESDILRLTEEIFVEIQDVAKPLVNKILDKKVKVSRSGEFGRRLLEHYSLIPPVNKKTGKTTLAKSALNSLMADFPDHVALKWLTFEPIQACMLELGDNDKWAKSKPERVYDVDPNEPILPEEVIYEIKLAIYKEANPDLPHIINIDSNAHLSWILFEGYGCEPVDFSRETKKPKVSKDALAHYEDVPFVAQLLQRKKLEKMLSTYVRPILEKNHNGWIYPSMLQFGTTSGRYSCAGGLNLQTLPRDDKRIKQGFIAPPGYKVVNADFSALEPRIFSWVSGDPGLKLVWQRGLDLYSQIAIDVFGLEGVSANPDDKNYLKNLQPQARQDAKVFTLAVPYGANYFRIAGLMKVEPERAKEIVDNYLDSYPELKNYMKTQETACMKRGMVRTKFGRVRHLEGARELYKKHGTRLFDKRYLTQIYGEYGSETYYKFRNYLNNAKNFPIQATAAHVCNAALIKLARQFKKHKIDGWIALQVHDEITCIVKEDQAEFAAGLLKDAMENNTITVQLDVPIIAEPLVADNFADAK